MSVASASAGRFVTMHGHFYQPPRENPWLEKVEVEEGAAPYHDWNERITAECYAPNTAARRVDASNRIINIVDNYQKISFNFGPTLLSWLESHRPEAYADILNADRASQAERGGHGNAIAQAYNHIIMPLATRRDKLTQALWGLEDFRHRFGRAAEGMWLPETAADRETLAVLAEAGLRFTILAPSQCRRVRPLDGGQWAETAGERVDPSRAYRYAGSGERSLALFFYDGAISQAIAFEGALQHGDTLAARLLAGFSAGRREPQLVHAATDGESYGHHTRFGDMALAAALERIEKDGEAVLTNYGAFLAAHPPTHEAEIVESSSWSCTHGVERWRSDCGCHAGHPEWHQRWRAPLREALDWLRDQLDPFYEARLGTLLSDPWAARDDYIRVILDRSPRSKAEFFARHQRVELDYFHRVEALRLLELQRHRLLMYTSCGWFFDDISGLEAAQVLKYAARAMQLAAGLGLGGLEDAFIHRLAAAPSNVPEYGTGAEVYRRSVRPAVVDVPRVMAHYAISGLIREYAEKSEIFCFRVHRLDARRSVGETTFMVGRVRVQCDITDEAEEGVFAVLRAGGEDFHCVVRGILDPAAYAAVRDDLLGRHRTGGISELIHGLDRHFPDGAYALRDLFLDERRRILSEVAEGILERCAIDFQRIWEETRRLLRDFRDAGLPIPDPLLGVARRVLLRETARLVDDGVRTRRMAEGAYELVAEARSLGVDLDLTTAANAFRDALASAMEALGRDPEPETVHTLVALLDAADRLGLRVPRWRLQNLFFHLWLRRPGFRGALTPLAAPLGFSLDGLLAGSA